MEIVVYVAIPIAFVSIVVVQFWWSNRRSLVTNWPVLGMIPTFLNKSSQIHDFGTYILRESDGTFLFKGPWFCGMDFLATVDPMNVHHTFKKNFSNYPKGPEFNDIFEYIGDGIFNADSESWQIQRNMIHSLFKDRRFELVVRSSMKQKISEGLFSVLDHTCIQRNEVDMKDVFQRFTFDNSCVLVLGVDPNTLSVDFPHVPFEKAFDDIGQGFFYRHIVPGFIWKMQRWLKIGEEKKMMEACQTFDLFVDECIKRKQEHLQQNTNVEEFDVLTYFMQVEDERDKARKLSNKFIRDIAVNLLVAGRDSTSAALSWAFWLIGTNPSSQNKILEEMKQHFGSDNDDKWRFFDFEKLKKLVYLHAVICEVLRLYPPLPFNRKVSVEPDVLPSGHHISRNTRIIFSLYSMGRTKEIWGEDCLEFKPERWISENGGIKNYPTCKFIAFNTGPRSCLGKDMSFLQMKVVICAILWNYSLELVEDQDVIPACSVILHQKNGLKVRVFKREASKGE